MASGAQGGSTERQALRSALLQLQEAEEAIPNDFLPELATLPAVPMSSLVKERRVGSVSAYADVLNVSAAAVAVGAAPVNMPSDKLETMVAFSGYSTDPRQKELHKGTQVLQATYTGAADRR
jgi:hypothetical protein